MNNQTIKMSNLTKIQNEIRAPKNNVNEFGKYKYRTAEDIEAIVKPLLDKYQCQMYISDDFRSKDGLYIIESTVTFIDGEKVIKVTAQAGIDPNTKGMNIAQCFGASSSYARKYALTGLFLIDDVKDPDATNDHKEVDLTHEIKSAKSIKDLTDLYNTHKAISKSKDLMGLMARRKNELL